MDIKNINAITKHKLAQELLKEYNLEVSLYRCEKCGKLGANIVDEYIPHMFYTCEDCQRCYSCDSCEPGLEPYEQSYGLTYDYVCEHCMSNRRRNLMVNRNSVEHTNVHRREKRQKFNQ